MYQILPSILNRATMRRLDVAITGQSLIPMKLVLYNDLVVRESIAPPADVMRDA